MKVITKYISKQIISIFLLCNFIFILLYLLMDFILRIDNFVGAGVPLTLFFIYLIFRTPTMLVQVIIPAATVISIIVVICQMKKNKEIMAMKACGLNLHTAFQPVIIISIIISIFTLFLAETVVPYTSTRSSEIWEIDVNKLPQASFQEFYKSEDNNIYWIKHFNIDTKTMNDPVFYFFDNQFNIKKIISGETCRWLGEQWELENARIVTLENTTPTRPRYILDIPETPETFINKLTQPEDMTYAELKNRAKKAKAGGYDNTSDLVYLYMKLSYPFMAAVLALIAIPIGLWEKTSGIPVSITMGMLTIFLFMVSMGYARAFGRAGTLPPLLSAWTANILFTLLGIYLLMNIKK